MIKNKTQLFSPGGGAGGLPGAGTGGGQGDVFVHEDKEQLKT